MPNGSCGHWNVWGRLEQLLDCIRILDELEYGLKPSPRLFTESSAQRKPARAGATQHQEQVLLPPQNRRIDDVNGLGVDDVHAGEMLSVS